MDQLSVFGWSVFRAARLLLSFLHVCVLLRAQLTRSLTQVYPERVPGAGRAPGSQPRPAATLPHASH